jgi:hypothetical protein
MNPEKGKEENLREAPLTDSSKFRSRNSKIYTVDV